MNTVIAAVSASAKRVRRVVGQDPPPQHISRFKHMLMFMFGVESWHQPIAHEPQFHKKLRALVKYVNDDLSSEREWVHYCRHQEGGPRCCDSDEDCQAKVSMPDSLLQLWKFRNRNVVLM